MNGNSLLLFFSLKLVMSYNENTVSYDEHITDMEIPEQNVYVERDNRWFHCLLYMAYLTQICDEMEWELLKGI